MAPQERKLSERQRREVDYHKERAKLYETIQSEQFAFDVIEQNGARRRWWNAYWEMYWTLIQIGVQGKNGLVVGCGFGEDALRLAKLGAEVDAFDLSAESLSIARTLAEREGLTIGFREMPAEQMDYEANEFDLIVARDILHHVDIPETMDEIIRVAKDGALFVFNEVYSHSITDKVRHSALIDRVLYPLMQNFIYNGERPYITADERKLTEIDIREISGKLSDIESIRYFNFLVTRLFPSKYPWVSRMDNRILSLFGGAARYLGGRVLATGRISK